MPLIVMAALTTCLYCSQSFLVRMHIGFKSILYYHILFVKRIFFIAKISARKVPLKNEENE